MQHCRIRFLIVKYSYIAIACILSFSIAYNIYLYHKYTHAINRLTKCINSQYIGGSAKPKDLDNIIKSQENDTLNILRRK